MRRTLVLFLFLALVSSVSFAALSNEEQIRKRIDEFAAAWNKHDPTEMAYLWSADGDLINPFGQKASGLLQLQRLFQTEQSGPLKQSTFTVGRTSVRFLEPGLALLDADVEITGIANPDGTTGTIKPHVTNLMRKSGGQWWIVSSRAFLFPPPPAAAAAK